MFRVVIHIVVKHSITLNQVCKKDRKKYDINHVNDNYLDEYLILTFRNVITQDQ